MSKYSSKDRQVMEEKHGQRTIFDQINEMDAIIEDKVLEDKQESSCKSVSLEKIEKEYKHETFSLDQFSGQDEPYYDMLVGFNLSKEHSENDFVTTALKEDFSSIAEFKKFFDCEIAFAQKEYTESNKIVGLYEKRIEVVRLKDKKNKNHNRSADKEAKEIQKLESDNYSSDEVEILSTPEKSEKKKSKSSNKI